MKHKAIVVGMGNIGRNVIKAIMDSPDFELIGVIRRVPDQKAETKEYANVDEIGVKPDVAILCVPSVMSQETAKFYLSKGINVVDSFDIHKEINDYVANLEDIAKRHNKVAMLACGWDPGTDSLVRAIFKIFAPKAITYTNFGPGMSMGHSVEARRVKGVKEAVSITLPLEESKHGRKVYVEPDGSLSKEDIYKEMKQNKYFENDPLEIVLVDDVAPYYKTSHGVKIVMDNEENHFEFGMRIDNPTVTARVLLACARASLRQPKPGAYTIIDVPLSYMLEDDRKENIRKLV
ncbi:MAG: diaminopimelate dehydrogenase [Lactobacillaceae bacterium]|nr:diaminopimelate dehydrogenase [Lactobacillaceae bacterium]